MANEEHLKILRLGATIWNPWRKKYPGVRPNLSKVKQFGVSLRGTDLSKANLSGADLSGMNLTGVNLREADLSKANLTGVSLIGTDLSKANLTGADLSRVNLIRTNVNEADLSRVSLAKTVFAAINLSTVIGLDTVQHREFSTIGIDTLYLSQGKISEIFLRGCGIPDTLIKNLPLLLNTTPVSENFTLSQEDIAQQQALLANYRRTLASYIQRLSMLSTAHAPPELTHGVAETRRKIARVKGILRASGVQVHDHPDDTDD